MARTTLNIPFNGKSVDDIYRIMDTVMNRHGYARKIVKGEEVWCKGDGVLMKLQCFGVSFSEHEVTLQGWMGDALLGDSDLSGFAAALPKRKMRSIMNEVASIISA